MGVLLDTDERNPIGLTEADLDTRVNRVYRLERLEELLRTGADKFANPQRWDDPFENVLFARTTIELPGGVPLSLGEHARDWCRQRWSLHAEADAIGRIYSPDPKKAPIAETGVKLRSTIGRVFENAIRAEPRAAYLRHFAGQVEYLTEGELRRRMTGLAYLDLVAAHGLNPRFAALFFMKRETFSHEAEVRFLFYDEPLDGRRDHIGDGLRPIAVDANRLFDEAALDPRLAPSQVDAVRARLAAAGWRGPVEPSELHRKPSFTIPPRRLPGRLTPKGADRTSPITPISALACAAARTPR